MDIYNVLKDIVSIPSESGNEKTLCNYLKKYMESLGFSVESQEVSDGRFNVLAAKGKGPYVMLYGHIDTVKAARNWTRDPFAAERNNDIVYGLGSFDMKGGIVGILKTCEKIDNVKVAFCVDEENDSLGAEILKNSDWLKDVILVISTEPVNGRGLPTIYLGRRGRIEVDIEVFGRSSHAANNDGINAIDDSAVLISDLNKLEMDSHPKLGKGDLKILSIESERNLLSTPEYVKITASRHFVTDRDFDYFAREIKDVTDKSDIKSEVKVDLRKRKTPYKKPFVTSEENKIVSRSIELIKKRYGRCDVEYGKSVADDNVFAEKSLPVVIIGPKGGNCHAADEWVDISSISDISDVISDIVHEKFK